jgi:hypothetical protein
MNLTLRDDVLNREENIMVEDQAETKIGCWVRTIWDDVGARDGVLVDRELVYFPYDLETVSINYAQIIAVGNPLIAVNTGL